MRKADLEEPLDGEPHLAMESSPSQRVLAGEQAVLLAQSLEELPADQREAVRLRFLEGCSLAEIAERLSRSREAAAGLLKRGLFQLRSRLT
jgi:RNA polymerase sigma-70 factor (ECF subfamily)